MFTHTSPSWVFAEIFRSVVQQGTAFDETNDTLAFGVRVKKVTLASTYSFPNDEAADVTLRKMVAVEGGFKMIRVAFVAPTDPLLDFVSVANKQSSDTDPGLLTRMCIGADSEGNPCFVLVCEDGDAP